MEVQQFAKNFEGLSQWWRFNYFGIKSPELCEKSSKKNLADQYAERLLCGGFDLYSHHNFDSNIRAALCEIIVSEILDIYTPHDYITEMTNRKWDDNGWDFVVLRKENSYTEKQYPIVFGIPMIGIDLKSGNIAPDNILKDVHLVSNPDQKREKLQTQSTKHDMCGLFLCLPYQSLNVGCILESIIRQPDQDISKLVCELIHGGDYVPTINSIRNQFRNINTYVSDSLAYINDIKALTRVERRILEVRWSLLADYSRDMVKNIERIGSCFDF